MTSRPIIFDSESVRAILAGRKTQTRRAVKPQPNEDWYPEVGFYHPVKVARDGEEYPGDEVFGAADEEDGRVCPYGAPGDELWVRETFCHQWHDPPTSKGYYDGYWYAATDPQPVKVDGDGWIVVRKNGEEASPWRSPIHMPRTASRLTLRVTEVRVERVQEISNTDAMAEGIPGTWGEWGANAPAWALSSIEEPGVEGPHLWDNRTSAENFALRWNSINKKRGFGWDVNPWVWVLSFERN